MLPHDTVEAQRLAQRHEAGMKGNVQLDIGARRKLRHAMEIRNESFVDASFIKLLRKYKVALVVADAARKWPYLEDVTADFVYLRLHGDEKLYESGYSEQAIDRWAERIRAWAAGGQPADASLVSETEPPRRDSRDVYCYFDNDVKVKAPFDARKLMDRLGLPQALFAPGERPEMSGGLMKPTD